MDRFQATKEIQYVKTPKKEQEQEVVHTPRLKTQGGNGITGVLGVHEGGASG